MPGMLGVVMVEAPTELRFSRGTADDILDRKYDCGKTILIKNPEEKRLQLNTFYLVVLLY